MKKNQETLHDKVERYFQYALEIQFKDIDYQSVRTVEKGHGRMEMREYYLASDISWLESRKDWQCLKSIGMVISNCTRGNVKTTDTQYFIVSINGITEFSNTVRQHWGIESCHWTLDITFKEEASRIRKENEPENAALLRKMALNILKIDTQKDKAKDIRPYSYKILTLRIQNDMRNFQIFSPGVFSQKDEK